MVVFILLKKVVVKIVGHKLTVKQKLFADEYLKSGNATDAAVKAGYSARTAQRIGSENLSKPLIKAYITAKMQDIEDAKIMDAKEALELLTKIARAEIEETVTIGTPDGIEQAKQPPSIKDRVSAIKEVLKRYQIGELERVQLRKAIADARMAEAKATVAEKLGQEKNNQIDAILDKLEEEINESGSGSN